MFILNSNEKPAAKKKKPTDRRVSFAPNVLSPVSKAELAAAAAAAAWAKRAASRPAAPATSSEPIEPTPVDVVKAPAKIKESNDEEFVTS